MSFWILATTVVAQRPETTLRGPDEGDGPYKRLILRGATIIDGSGAPPRGPVDIVIENDLIAEIRSVGFPGVPINEKRRPGNADYEIDLTGHYIMPGFVDMHGHTGSESKTPQPEYVYIPLDCSRSNDIKRGWPWVHDVGPERKSL